MFNLVLLCPDNLPEHVDRQTGEVQEMRALFADWDPVLGRFLAKVDKVDRWKSMHRAGLDSWISPTGNLSLIGDASQPMLPYLAQGANSAPEDGAVLGALLAKFEGRAELKSTIAIFEQLPKSRSERIQKAAFLRTRTFLYP